MSILFIDEIKRTPRSETIPPLFEGSIDSPKLEETFDEYTLTLNGWALTDGVIPPAIEIFLDNKAVRTTKPRWPRPDIVARHGGNKEVEGCGFRCMIGVMATAPQWKIRVEAVAHSGRRHVIGTIAGRRSPAPAAPSEYLQPLLVTGLGRSGSTYLMRLLSLHPGIVTLNKYPYESRMAQYQMHMARVTCEPVNEGQSAQRSKFWASPWWTGNNPYYANAETSMPELKHWLGHTYVHSMLEFCNRSTEEFYRLMADAQQSPQALYFAEKATGEHQWMLRETYPGMREIFLVRDFRDTICSILAFNSKRGVPEFGRENASSDKEFILRLRPQIAGLSEQWKRRGEHAHLLRYEDLIEQPKTTLQYAFDYLGLDADESLIEGILIKGNEDTVELKSHRTSSAAQSSIGRWKTDLSPELQDACHESFGDLLPHFGYA